MPDVPDADLFDCQMGRVARFCNVLPLEAAIDGLRHGSLPSRAACITFDDGYADNATVALPILQRHGLPATFFISTGFLDGGLMWNDRIIESIRRSRRTEIDLSDAGLGRCPLADTAGRRSAAEALIKAVRYKESAERSRLVDLVADRAEVRLPTDLMMTSDQVRALRRSGMDIGGHTVSHPILARLDPGAAREEIRRGKLALEQIIGEPVRHFAYPNGVPGKDYDSAHVEMVKELGFSAAVSTAWGVATPQSDLFQLPRFTPWDRGLLKFLARFYVSRRNTRPATV